MTEYAYVMFGYNRILGYYKDYLIIKTKQNKLKNTKLKNSKVTKCKNKLENLDQMYFYNLLRLKKQTKFTIV